MRVLAGWRGAGVLAMILAVAVALPLVFGRGEHATWDWSLLFITLLFIMLPTLCFVQIALTILLLGRLSGRRYAIEAASLLVPGALLEASRDGYFYVLRFLLESN